MRISDRFRGWRRRQRRKSAAQKEKSPLREFVYLDEVSVYSLIASRLGPIAAEFTETETASLQGELTSSFGANVGVAKAEVASRADATQTQGSQVLRKSIVQTAFKELYELEKNSLAMGLMDAGAKPPTIRNLAQLEAAVGDQAFGGWILDMDALARGRLLEVEVELEAEAIFRVSAVLSSILEIIDENPELFPGGNYGELLRVRSVNRVIEKLLVGLIPIRGRAIDFDVVELKGAETLVHRGLLSQLAEGDRPKRRPLYLVGVAQQSLFWKDIRRILFSKARFRVLCRLAQSGLQESWTPVKLVDVLRDVVPEVALQVDIASRGALVAMGGTAAAGDLTAEQKRQAMRAALLAYATSFAEHYGKSVTEEDLAQSGLPTADQCNAFGTLKDRRQAFDAITSYIERRCEIKRDPVVAAQYRSAALLDAGIGLDGQLTGFPPSFGPPTQASSEGRYLDAEIVALYW